MRRNLRFILFGAFLLASCAPEPAPVPTAMPSPTAAAVTHAPEIRFALIGEPRDVNAWELFDESGASYADYALRFEYWPRLYHLAPPDLAFEALAANGMPSLVVQEGGFYSATVTLRTDLKWTDGSAFTAQDVAFTVNTALAFGLGFDWKAYYSPDHIERVEVADSSTVKFIFKRQPNVGLWQYGALQGPILQKAYWGSLISEAAGLLPDDAMQAELEDARLYLASVQIRVEDLNAQASALAVIGEDDRAVLAELAKKQNELIFAQNTLDKIVDESTAKIALAQEALYAVDDEDEPTLGTWMPAGKQDGTWVNEANPDFPFIKPNFDRATYTAFPDGAAVIEALENREVDVFLSPKGLSRNLALSLIDGKTAISISQNEAMASSFIVINPAHKALSDPVFRRAFYCAVRHIPLRNLIGSTHTLFVLSGNGNWLNPDAVVHCGDGFYRTAIVEILKSAGYTWVKEPAAEEAGDGLILPDGSPFPAITLLTQVDDFDGSGRVDIVNSIETVFHDLGIPLTLKFTDAEDIRYRIFSSKEYDLAILSWNLSLYPDYLCEWFGAGRQFEYGSDRLRSECEGLAVESDFETARQHIFQIQSILMEDLPFIPLHAQARYDAYRNVRYPFEHLLGGLDGLYGAPSHAMPAP
jgi:peptide/nickel transport system substrate-binding protein